MIPRRALLLFQIETPAHRRLESPVSALMGLPGDFSRPQQSFACGPKVRLVLSAEKILMSVTVPL